MKKTILDAMEKIAEADRRSPAVTDAAKAMARGLRSRQATFDSQHETVKEKIERGGKLTKYRVPL